MKQKRLLNFLSKVCAETPVQIPKGVSPDEVMQKLSKHFKAEQAGFGIIRFHKKTIFPACHFLEMQVVDNVIECQLRIGFIDRIIASILLLVVNLMIVAAPIVSIVFNLLAKPENILIITLFFSTAMTMNVAIFGLYRFYRWFAGMSHPEQVLENCGLRSSAL